MAPQVTPVRSTGSERSERRVLRVETLERPKGSSVWLDAIQKNDVT